MPELSKNEQKKLAKKAEKAAKKAAAKQGGTSPSDKQQNGGNDNPSTKTPAVAPLPPPVVKDEVKLSNLKHNAASLKVVWATEAFGIAVTPSRSIQNTAGDGNADDKPYLTMGSQIVSGGGNAMVQTISYMSSCQSLSYLEQMLVDDWCEWERTVLRPAVGTKKINKALEHLETSISGRSVVGSVLSSADISILSTLHFAKIEGLPASIASYVKAHSASLNGALKVLQDFVEATKPPQELDPKDPSLSNVVESIFRCALFKLFPSWNLPKIRVSTKCANVKHGDYQCNAAMPVFAALKKSGDLPESIKSPQDVADAIMNSIGNDHPVVYEFSKNGPGFVLCRIRPSCLEYHINQLVRREGTLPLPKVPKQTCVVDFSSPNIAKEMHVGHLRSTILGEAVCRVLEFVGHDVHRVNHVGDWGTQFGMLIQYLKEEYPEVSNGTTKELPNITDLTVFYKSAKQRFDEDPVFKKTSQTNVVALQSGDEDCRRIWQMLCDVSRIEFEKVYQRLDVTTVERGESFYNDKIAPVIDEFIAAGRIKIDGGAKCVFVDKYRVPLMLQKSDGGYGYDSTDMAALNYRLFELKADRIIVITDFSQGDHFAMCYQAARDIGWVSEQSLEHIGFGTVQGEDGKRFKTRSGDTVRLVDLLDEAVGRMENSLRERISEGKSSIAEEDIRRISEAIGYGAVKYYDLKRNPTTNYKFSYDQMLDTKGDTGVYLLYARVRLESILEKAAKEHNVKIGELLDANEPIVLGHPVERSLAFALQQFVDVIEQTLENLYPCHICEYIYKLSIASSDFVTQCKVLGSPEMKSRLLLCHTVIKTMCTCFDLLGIRHVTKI